MSGGREIATEYNDYGNTERDIRKENNMGLKSKTEDRRTSTHMNNGQFTPHQPKSTVKKKAGFVEQKRTLNASVPPPRRAGKKPDINKSFTQLTTKYNSGNKEDSSFRTITTNYQFRTKKASVIAEIEDYLVKTQKRAFTFGEKNDVDDLSKMNRLYLENRLMRTEFKTINQKINTLLGHIDLSAIQTSNRPSLKLTRSTDRDISAMRMKVREREASNYDKIIANLEHEYSILEKRLNFLANPSYKLALEQRISVEDKEIERHRQEKKLFLHEHVKKEHQLKRLLQVLENGTDPKDLNEAGNALAFISARVNKTSHELDKSNKIVEEKIIEYDQLEERYEKLIIIGRKYDIDVEDVVGEKSANKQHNDRMEEQYNTSDKIIKQIHSYIRNLKGKMGIMNKDFNAKFREYSIIHQTLLFQLQNKQQDVEKKREELMDLIAHCKRLDNVSLMAILHKWEYQDAPSSRKYRSTAGSKSTRHYRHTSNTANTNSRHVEKVMETSRGHDTRMALFIQAYFRMWLYKNNFYEGSESEEEIKGESKKVEYQEGNSANKTNKPEFKRKKAKKWKHPVYPYPINANEDERGENNNNNRSTRRTGANKPRGKAKLTAEEDAILSKYEKPKEEGRESPQRKSHSHSPSKVEQKGNPQVEKTKQTGNVENNPSSTNKTNINIEEKKGEHTPIMSNTHKETVDTTEQKGINPDDEKNINKKEEVIKGTSPPQRGKKPKK